MTGGNEKRLTFMQIHFFYEMYLENFYRQNSALVESNFHTKIQSLVDDAFSGIHILAPYMRELNYNSFFSIANDPVSQGQWLKESGEQISGNDWVKEIARLQVETIKPDVLYLSEPITLDSSFIRSLSYKPQLVIGWRAANIPATTDWSEFDIILSCLSGLREAALDLGARSAEHFWPGFPVQFYEQIKHIQPEHDIMFCGQWTTAQHQRRNELLELVAHSADAARPHYKPAFYLSGQTKLLPENVRNYHQGERYGLSMFKAIRSAHAVFDARGSIAVQGDKPIDVAKKETANMRIFEATGCGRLLFTEEYQNLRELFTPGKEIVTYRSEKDLIDKIRFYKQNRELASEIALAGMQRCHSDHSMSVRVRRMDSIIRERLSGVTNRKYQIEIQSDVSHVQRLEREKEDAFLKLDRGELEEAFELLTEMKSKKVALLDVDFARAVYFIKKESLGDARQCLLEELRHFPDNPRARDMLAKVEEAMNLPSRMAHYEPEFKELMEKIDPYTMLPVERLYSLYRLTKTVCERDLPGNFVECGVAGGGSTALMAHLIGKYSKRPRKLFACDSYEGMPEPSEHDILEGQSANDTGWGVGTCAAPEDSVKEVSSLFGVSDIVEIVKGYFENSLPPRKKEIGDIAFIHIDCDWYESTKTVLNELYDQFVPDGYCQIDDYGYWEGMEKAFSEFQEKRGLRFDIQTIDGMSAWFNVPPAPKGQGETLLVQTENEPSSYQNPIHTALELLNHQKTDQVISLFDKDEYRTRSDVQLILGVAYARRNEISRAKACLIQVLKDRPTHAYATNLLNELRDKLEYATDSSQKGDSVNAEQLLTDALYCLRNDKIDDAQGLLDRISVSSQGVRDFHYASALCSLQKGKVSDGIKLLENELQMFPDNASARVLLERLQA